MSLSASISSIFDKNRLLYNWITLNAVGVALAFMAWNAGWMGEVLKGDQTFITHGILALFLYLFARVAWATNNLNRDINRVGELREKFRLTVIEEGETKRPVIADGVAMKLLRSISPIQTISTYLVMLGLIGTVVGIIIAFRDIPLDVNGNQEVIKAIVAGLVNGMSVAFYTTLVGAIGYLWISNNCRILRDAAEKLYHDIVRG